MLSRFSMVMRPLTAGVQRRQLNIHEYSSKQLLQAAGCKVEEGYLATTLAEVKAACEKIKTPKKVVKAQILAGGRGKGTFVSGLQGGVAVTENTEAAVARAAQMLHGVLVTKQTGPAGLPVTRLFITETIPNIKRELYVALTLDRATAKPLFVASQEGGVNIEELAEKHPEKIVKVAVSGDVLTEEQAKEMATKLGFKGDSIAKAAQNFVGISKLAKANDATMVEINPMAELDNGDVYCLDAKIALDDNARFRHEAEWAAMEDTSQKDSKEVEADAAGLNYIALDGNVGCLVNGAGLAMATMDLIALYGSKPANFLDVGGSAKSSQIVEAFKIITKDPKVKCILVNIFGGIMKCDVIAQGIIEAAKTMGAALKVPVVVRLDGTNEAEGKKLLNESGMKLISANDLEHAAQLANEQVKKSTM